MSESILNSIGETGVTGENFACEYLLQNGYVIIDRNVKIGRLEIDIICKDRSHIVFVEVKTKDLNSCYFGSPASAVNYKKQQNLIKASLQYLKNNHFGLYPRIDVIEVYVDITDDKIQLNKINHIRNAVTRN